MQFTRTSRIQLAVYCASMLIWCAHPAVGDDGPEYLNGPTSPGVPRSRGDICTAVYSNGTMDYRVLRYRPGRGSGSSASRHPYFTTISDPMVAGQQFLGP